MMNDPRMICVPLSYAEFLHATLGPLADVLEAEGHGWAEMVKRVLAEYTLRRNMIIGEVYGPDAYNRIASYTMAAAEEVEYMVHEAITDFHFQVEDSA